MNREFLKELGIEEEQINSIMKEHGKSLNSIKDKADKVDSLESQIEDYKGQLQDRDKQLEELSEKAKDNEELNNKIKELQDTNKQTAADYEDKLKEQQKNFAIQSALRDANVHDPDLATKALDVESISLKDGKLIGLDEQLNELKENKAFLFKNEEEDKNLAGRNPHPSNPNDPKPPTKKFGEMTSEERLELKEQDPTRYKKMREEYLNKQ